MKRLIHLLTILCFLPLLAPAQTIKGKIVDDTQTPVVGAYIIHLQSEHHAHSNELGKFFLNNIKTGDSLQIMHLGYKSRFYIVDDLEKEITIELEETIFQLDEVVIGQNVKTTSIISNFDIRTNPVNSTQEILRKVPGLFIGQHAGGGKAEQIFLRGFDIDHGTDVAITVDGMPVNMVSHAHGQGYADLHFLIPETIDQIDFGKGPYYADKGNFNTAGYVAFKTKDRLDNSMVSVELGSFNTFRTVGLLNLLDTDSHRAYIATEYLISDGPFESSQNFVRNNLMAKYSANLNRQDQLSVIASHFSSTWDASGQIPQRAVDQGLITRFGAIDDTEGGTTSRTNLAINFNRAIDDHTFITNNAYYSLYDFELYSNFTFFLNDPVNRDQIRQREDRQIFGLESVWNDTRFIKNTDTYFRLGVGVRSDKVQDNELSRTRDRRTTLRPIQLGDVQEKNVYTFTNIDFDFDRWLIQAGLRLDYFNFNYVSDLDTVFNRQAQSRSILSPKFNIIYNLSKNVQLFAKSGIGFHSNDTRVVLSRDQGTILPAAYGADLGATIKPSRRMIINLALWYLYLEQEFVYVGDEGVVEPSGRTRRLGVDFSLRQQLSDWLFINGDFNYAFARSIDEPEGLDYIPIAPVYTVTGGINAKKKGFSGGINFRAIGDRPANEDNSIVAEGYFITDLYANYQYKRLNIGFNIENLFNQEWNETQFATESRLQFEPDPIEEIHFTPGTPFFIKGIVRYRF